MLPLLPDAEVLVVNWLSTHPDLLPLHGGRVATELDPQRPAVRVVRAPTPGDDPDEGRPSLQVECWAGTQEAASVLARSIVACLPDIWGVHGEGVVRGWEMNLGPFFAPDPDTHEPRYVLGFALLTYPS